MNRIPLNFIDNLPRNPHINAAVSRIKSRIEQSEDAVDDPNDSKLDKIPDWADEDELIQRVKDSLGDQDESDDTEVKRFRIILKETETINLFEVLGSGHFEGSQQSEDALYYNSIHEQYQNRKSTQRILTSSEVTQTDIPLLLRKSIQTKKVVDKEIGCTVTEWDMMDSFKKMERKFKRKDKELKTSDLPLGQTLTCAEKFLKASQTLQRLLASNNFSYEQLIYTNQPFETGRKFKYSFRILWKMKESGTGGVNCLSTNPLNKNLIAVGYGNRNEDGAICIWNAKNPHTPEKKLMLQHPVSGLEFSKESPYLLAAVTEAGDVLLVDIKKCEPQVTIVSSSVSNVIKDSLWSVTWFPETYVQKETENIVTTGDRGVVMVWNPFDGEKRELDHLTYNKIPFDNMHIHRHTVEQPKLQSKFMRSNFQAVDIEKDPSDRKIYYVSTTQGSLLVCKTSKVLGPATPFPAHRGAVLGVRHSPAIPSVYLTHGSDAKTLVWVHGIKCPIVALTTDSFDPVTCALWSPSHCSVILTLTRGALCLWDIRRSVLDPMTIVLAENDDYFTTAVFNDKGTVIFVGAISGVTTTYNLYEMPHQPYLQKSHMLAAFKKILWRNKDLYEEVEFTLNR